MSYEVLQVSKQELQTIKNHYSTSLKSSPPQGAAFAAKLPGCSITGYQSGKVLFQGKKASAEAVKWQKNATVAAASTTGSSGRTAKKADDHKYAPPAGADTLVLLGSDETGTGDYFGPMTVVCVHLTTEQMKTIDSWGVRDSKTIRDDTIRELAPRLIKTCTYSLLVLKNEKYNDMQANGMNQGQMKALLHHQAITNVMKKCREEQLFFDGILVDQFVSPEGYFKYLAAGKKQWQENISIYFATKAEGLHPSVAAASILARYSFIIEMDKLSEKTGLTIPKGAGPVVDKAAKDIMLKHGKDALYRLTKWHFSNTKRVLDWYHS